MFPAVATQESLWEKRLEAKTAELQSKKHLPEQMVALVSEVTRLQHARLPEIRFHSKEDLGAEILGKLSPVEKRPAGLAILPGKEFPLDMPQVKALAQELLEKLPRKAPFLAACAEGLAPRLAGPGIFEAACREVLDPSLQAKDLPLLGGWAQEHPDAPFFFRFIMTSAVLPSLVVVGRILGEDHDTGKVWQHGHCPVCGNLPLIGRLMDKEGLRMHSCSFCGFEYRAPRMGCPFCLEPETEGSEYHVSGDEPGYLLAVCKSCKNYFKLGDFRELDRPWFPLLDDLSSLTLDMYAAQMDYKRPTLSGWGF